MYMWTMFLPLYARYRLTKWRYQEVRGYSWPEVRGERESERERERKAAVGRGCG